MSASLADLGAEESAARLWEVAGFVGSCPLKSVAELAKKIGATSPETGGQGEKADLVGAALLAAARLLETGGGAKAFITDLKSLGEAFAKPALRGATLSQIRIALERLAPPPPPLEGVRTELVIAYLHRFEAALGEPDFHDVFAELKVNKQMRQVEIAALASAFMSKGPAKERRDSALLRILGRHQNLESIAGRNKAGRAAA
ncbi:MAG: hypothetical protein SGJ17_02195 [Hyphomicrobiales bacterium]|nr:hypothetical protein [Hyphomicrobiales bacterium]